jgi:FlaA1/EpsC-like NDP-sugar epimerase
LYEELLNDQENTLPTHHSKITVAKIKEYEFESISKAIDELISLFPLQNNMNIVSKMKQIVPEFISNNSMYEVLDKPGAAVSS